MKLSGAGTAKKAGARKAQASAFFLPFPPSAGTALGGLVQSVCRKTSFLMYTTPSMIFRAVR